MIGYATHYLFKKKKTCTLFLSRYRNTSESLGEREMLWEYEPQASVFTARGSSVFLSSYRNQSAGVFGLGYFLICDK